MKSKKAIFFDNDGILVDTEPLFFESNREVLRPYGVELTLEYFIEYSLTRGTGMDDLIAKEWRDKIDLLQLRKDRNKIYLKLLEEGGMEIFPQAGKVLKDLSKQLIIGIVTSSRREMFQKIHAQTGFLKYVDFVIDREDVIDSKPHPEPYLKALKLAKVEAHEALVIEDSARGLQSAVAAGIECWVIPTELTKHQDFSMAKKVLKNISEIKKYLS